MKTISKFVKETIGRLIIERTSHFKEVKYFHPSGKSMPNGCHFQRGGFLNECKINTDSFTFDEGVHDNQYGKNYRGGIIVFPTDVNAVTIDDDKMKQLIATFNNRMNRVKKTDDQSEKIGAYSVSNHFKGKYVGNGGEMYDERSQSVEINGISRRHLLEFAESLAQEFQQKTVIVKDLNSNKIYVADKIPTPFKAPLCDELSNDNNRYNG